MKLPAFPGYLGNKRRIAVELCRAMSKQDYLLEPYAGLGVVSYVYNSGMLFDQLKRFSSLQREEDDIRVL